MFKIKYVLSIHDHVYITESNNLSSIESDDFSDWLFDQQQAADKHHRKSLEQKGYHDEVWFEASEIKERMFSTNRMDNKGDEIYSGHIVEIPDNYDLYGMNAGEKYEVYFIEGSFRLKPKYASNIKRGALGFSLDESDELTIIGTIFENPELLPACDK